MARISDSAIVTFQEFNLRGNADYIMLRLNNGRIDISKTGNDAKTWEEFSSKFKADEACWALYHFKYTTKEGAKRSKLTMVQWIPHNCPKSDKMQVRLTS